MLESLENTSACCSLVKQYGRRMVWDLGRPIANLDSDAQAIQLAVNSTESMAHLRLVDVEVDELVMSHQDLEHVSSQSLSLQANS